MGHDGFAGRGGQHVRAQADDAARGDVEFQARAFAVRGHVGQRAFAARGEVDHRARILLGAIDGHLLDRLAFLAADLLDDDVGLAHLQFVAFAAHGLDQHREVQHAAAEDVERVGRGARGHAQGEILLQFAVEALLDVARGDVFAVLAEEGRVVDREEHRHRGFVDGDGGQRFGILVVADRVADLESLDAHDGADLSAGDLLDLLLAEPLEDHQLLDPGLLHRHAVALGEGDHLARFERSARDLAHGDTPRVGGVFERGDEHLRRALDDGRFGNLVDDGVQQRHDRVGRFVPLVRHPALLGRAVDGLVVELLLGGVEREHQVEDLFVDHLGAAVGLVHLVDHDDGLLAQREGLLQHEARLGHRALEGIDQQQHAVAHVQHALDLAAEVGVARGVDDVDLIVLVDDRNVLREDRDAAFAFQVVVVQYEFAGRLGVVPQDVSCQNHLVHECGFAVIDVGNNRNIAQFLHRNLFCGAKVTNSREIILILLDS